MHLAPFPDVYIPIGLSEYSGRIFPKARKFRRPINGVTSWSHCFLWKIRVAYMLYGLIANIAERNIL